MQQKHYIDIERLKEGYAKGFSVGDHIIIQEKLDGSTLAIRYDPDSDKIRAYSRKTELDHSNTLRGAFEWTQRLDKDKVKEVLGNHLILFAEWLQKHSVIYPEDKYGNAYCFDIFNTDTREWQSQDIVKQKVMELGLIYVPVFYDGIFVSWDHVRSFVGKTEMGGEYGEGIVLKSQTNLNSKNTKLPFYVKIVGEKFRETKAHKVKTIDPVEAERKEEVLSTVKSVVTKPRVTKIIHKMVDEGVLPEDWSCREMTIIAKNLGRLIYEDCIKEEPEVVNSIKSNFGKVANSVAMGYAREILQEREGVM